MKLEFTDNVNEYVPHKLYRFVKFCSLEKQVIFNPRLYQVLCC
jgi:hypothetical protein